MMIRKATYADIPEVARLAALLWPSHTVQELAAEYEGLLQSGDAAVFLCMEEGRAVGFSQCQLRHDYVEGTSSSPVGYLEGVFVEKDHRNRGHAADLLQACEQWAKAQGCTEFASDCALDNL